MCRILAAAFMSLLRSAFYLLLGLMLGMFSASAFSVESSTNVSLIWKTSKTGTVNYSSAGAACSAAWSIQSQQTTISGVDDQGRTYSWSFGGVNSSNVCFAVCSGTIPSCSSSGPWGFTTASKSCPVNYSLTVDGTMCAPAAADPCKSKDGQSFSASVAVADPTSISGASSVCQGGCQGSLENASPKRDSATGSVYMVGSWQYTGKSCTATDTPVTTDNPTPEDNPDPNKDDVITKSCTDNAGGGHTTSYTITHSDGTKDYQYVTLAGTCSGANDPTDPKSDFCEQNPTAAACVDLCADNPSDPSCTDRGSSGGATCTEAPSCDGDAIDCAVLNQIWQVRCEAENTSKKDPFGILGINIVAGADPEASLFPTKANGSTVDISQDWNTNETYIASCPPDVVFSIHGQNVSISFAPLCNFGEILGQLNVIFASLGAAYIIGRT